MEVIKSSRGGDKLCHNGFMCTKHRTGQTYIPWRCVQRTTGCKGAVTTDTQHRETDHLHDDNHNGNISAVQAAKAKCAVKRKAKQTEERPSSLYANTLAYLEDEARGHIGQQLSFERFVQRQRSDRFPPDPARRNDLVIDGEWTETSSPTPQRFLIYDNRPDSASPFALQKLVDASLCLMDGNFAMAPHQFLQLYVIRVPLGNSAVTTVYALLQRKTEQTYRELFHAIMDYCESQDLLS